MVTDMLTDAVKAVPNPYFMVSVLNLRAFPIEQAKQAYETVKAKGDQEPISQVEMMPMAASEALAYMDRVQDLKERMFAPDSPPDTMDFMAAIESQMAERINFINTHTTVLMSNMDEVSFG